VIDGSFYNISSRNIVKYPIFTSKTTELLENDKYTFKVNPYSDKSTIKKAIEYLFNVKIKKINTSHLPIKKKRVARFSGTKPHYKKAIITLIEGDSIKFY